MARPFLRLILLLATVSQVAAKGKRVEHRLDPAAASPSCPPMERIIETREDVAEGEVWLAANHPEMAKALEAIGEAPLRRRTDGFAALLQAIVGQQVSVAAAAGIWRRIEEAGFHEEAAVLMADDDGLRAAGLSRPKVRYAKAIAEARLDYDAFRTAPAEISIARLIEIKGIGRWTAEIYLMFAVGKADVFAPGDLALREAARALYRMEERPTIPALAELSEQWSPWRGVAARILFAYYRVVKGREGVS